MKVTINNESKKYITLSMLDAARRVVSECKIDECSAADYASFAVNAIGAAYDIGRCVKVLEVSARVAGNCRAWDVWEDSENLDVWIEGTARTADGFCDFGAYISDIWQLSADNSKQIARDHMYKAIYKRTYTA